MTIDGVSSTHIAISWSLPPEIDHNGIIRSYDVKITELETNTVIMQSTVNTEITVTSLHPYYQYEVLVAAVTTHRGPYSSALTITTDPAGMHVYIIVGIY